LESTSSKFTATPDFSGLQVENGLKWHILIEIHVHDIVELLRPREILGR